MGKLFRNNCLRGLAVKDLSCERVMNIGRAAALVMGKKTGSRPTIAIGRDTRVSSVILESALIAGICSVGADAVKLNCVPSAAVALLTKKNQYGGGIMITASNASYEMNGLKLYSAAGLPLSEDMLEEIENLILDEPQKLSFSLASHEKVGGIRVYDKAQWDYIRAVIKSVDSDLKGIRVAIDCAGGCAAETAKRIFEGLGAVCLYIGNEPDGININSTGTFNLEPLRSFVLSAHCHLGVAFDGDANRCIAVDENGIVIDGDKLLAIFAGYMKEHELLAKNTTVATITTNLGYLNFAKENGIEVATAKADERYIIEKLCDGGYSLGGDQYGHIVFNDFLSASDGQLTAAMLLQVVAETGKKLSELAAVTERFPQVQLNIKIASQCREIWKNDAELTSFIEQRTVQLSENGSGRIVVRESGFEPVILILAEGRDFESVNKAALEISDKIRERVKPSNYLDA